MVQSLLRLTTGVAQRNTKLLCDEVMKQNHSLKRHRGRSNGRRGSHGSSHSIESNGREVKIRGNPTQLFEKYQSLARDAVSSGDPISAENYLQHAEHYFRVMILQTSEKPNGGRARGNRESDRDGHSNGVSPAPSNSTGASGVNGNGDDSADGTVVE